MKLKSYIEFRVFFDNDANPDVISEIAEELKDAIVDYIGDNLTSEGMLALTQDVTYEKVVELEAK